MDDDINELGWLVGALSIMSSSKQPCEELTSARRYAKLIQATTEQCYSSLNTKSDICSYMYMLQLSSSEVRRRAKKLTNPRALSLVARRTNTTTTTSLSRAIPQNIHYHHQLPTPSSHIHPSRCSPDDSLRASRLRPSSLLQLPPDSSAPPSFPSSSLPQCRKGYQV